MVVSLLLTLLSLVDSSILEDGIDSLGLLQLQASKHTQHESRSICESISVQASDAWCTANCNHNPPNCPANWCSCDDAPSEQEVCVSVDPHGRTTDAWCQDNCNHNPPHCPAGFCECGPVEPQEPVQICDAVDSRVTKNWCETNCNHNPPFCPLEYCSCNDPLPEIQQTCVSKHPSHTTIWCNLNCNHNPPFCPEEFCGCRELELQCTSVKAPATNEWCFNNCNHNPRFCPEEFCACEEPPPTEPNDDCRSNSPQATDDWCHNNCNHVPAFCPAEFCTCEAPTTTAAPTTTVAPTTAAPTTAAPTTTTIDDGVIAIDDPHLSTIHGNKLDMFKDGEHVLLNIPKEAVGNDALLRVTAMVEKIGERENDLWIRKLIVSGQWLDDVLFFETKDGQFNDQSTQCVHRGEGCDQSATAEFVAQSVPALKIVPLKAVQQSPADEFAHANGKKLQLQVGPIEAKIRFGTAFKGGRQINHLDFRADGLSSVKESIGGELADDVSTVSFLSIEQE